MSWDWGDYLALASDLAKEANRPPLQEAKYRSAISRAYYSAFQKAYDRLTQVDGKAMPSVKTNKHYWVIQDFESSKDKTRRKIGADLDRLRRDRNVADYDRTISQPALQCEMALLLANAVLTNLSLL